MKASAKKAAKKRVAKKVGKKKVTRQKVTRRGGKMTLPQAIHRVLERAGKPMKAVEIKNDHHPAEAGQEHQEELPDSGCARAE